MPSSATATRFGTHWIADALAGDESVDFSVLQALLRASSEPLASAPEATHQRLALRTLQELSSLVPAGAGGDADAAATAGVLRVDGARSAEDVLFRIIIECERSGKLEKDLLPPFSQDIQETICTNKLTLPQTSFQLLEEVYPWITSNGCDTSKRNSIHQNEAYALGDQDEEPHQPRKRQKINARGNGYPKEVLAEKVPSAKQGQHVPTPPRERSSVEPQKRNSNPVAQKGRRERKVWTKAEEEKLREGMAIFAQNGELIPWIQILRYGRKVFDMVRLPSDLKVKWRNMQKKTAGGNFT